MTNFTKAQQGPVISFSIDLFNVSLLVDLFKVQPLDSLPITVKDRFQKANNI